MKTLTRVTMILACLLSLSLTLFFNSYSLIGCLILVCSILPIYREAAAKKRSALLAIIADVLILAGMLIPRYSVKTVCCLLAAALWIAAFVVYGRENPSKRSTAGVILAVVGWLALALPVLLFGTLGVIGLFPDGLARLTQFQWSEYPTAPQEIYFVHEDGVEVFAEITYPSDYPNNTLTVYKTSANKGTVFYMHGGGLVTGDKDNSTPWRSKLLDAGYNVVSIDYALAPQDPYPAAIRQANEALTFLVENASVWGIDPDRIALAGDSAGSQLTGQLACLLTDPAYAESMGIVTIAEKNGFRPMAYLSMSGLVDFPQFENTGVAFIDWLFHIWGAASMGDVDYASHAAAREASVVEHVTENFIPTFVSDANTGSFTDQGKRLVAKLETLGIEVESDFPTSERLFHDYEVQASTQSAQRTIELQIAFLDRLS